MTHMTWYFTGCYREKNRDDPNLLKLILFFGNGKLNSSSKTSRVPKCSKWFIWSKHIILHFGVSNKKTRPPPSSMKIPQFIGRLLIQLLFWGDDLREDVDHDHGMMSLKGQRREAQHERKRSGRWRCPQEIEKSLTNSDDMFFRAENCIEIMLIHIQRSFKLQTNTS